jgi:hypothetical protein
MDFWIHDRLPRAVLSTKKIKGTGITSIVLTSFIVAVRSPPPLNIKLLVYPRCYHGTRAPLTMCVDTTIMQWMCGFHEFLGPWPLITCYQIAGSERYSKKEELRARKIMESIEHLGGHWTKIQPLKYPAPTWTTLVPIRRTQFCQARCVTRPKTTKTKKSTSPSAWPYLKGATERW